MSQQCPQSAQVDYSLVFESLEHKKCRERKLFGKKKIEVKYLFTKSDTETVTESDTKNKNWDKIMNVCPLVVKQILGRL